MMLRSSIKLAACALSAAGLMSSCAHTEEEVGEREVKKAAWVKTVENEVGALGANNWIVVSERAYPTPQHSGVRVIVADAEIPEVVSEVMAAMESEGHIWPKIYTVREFEHLSEEYAPGVKVLKTKREAAFVGRKKNILTKRSMDTLVNSAMKDYRILLIKSSSNFPYSTVFMELDSGYWNGKSEDALRKKMKQ